MMCMSQKFDYYLNKKENHLMVIERVSTLTKSC